MLPNATIIDITDHSDEIEVLLEYDSMRKKCFKNLCELTYLQEFPDDYAKNIIKRMLNKYMDYTRMVNEQSNRMIIFTFVFRTRDTRVHQYTISNNMQFRNDILTIIYIYQLTHVRKHARRIYKVMVAMTNIMVDKYEIDIFSFNLDKSAITFINLSTCFLSIALDMCYNNFASFHEIPKVCPYFELPVMVYAPMIILILPKLKDPPFAIFLAIYLTMHEVSQMISDVSLLALWECINLFSESKVPETLKLYLCKKYDIVVMEGDEFKFAPCFEKYRQQAKEIISEKRPNDPELQNILSVI